MIAAMAQMSQPTDSRNARPRRHGRGFQAASLLLARRVQKAAEGRGFAVSRLLTHWSEIAGPDLAGVTRPVRISHSTGGFGATLTLLTTGPMAQMVQMQLPALRDRVNACYGYNAVQRIALTQTAPMGFAEGQARFSAEPARAPAPPDPQTERAAIRMAERFDDPTLAAAIQRLALNIATRKT